MFVPVSCGPETTVKAMDESTQTEISGEKLESQMESRQKDGSGREGKQEVRGLTKGAGGQDTQARTGKNVVTLTKHTQHKYLRVNFTFDYFCLFL